MDLWFPLHQGVGSPSLAPLPFRRRFKCPGDSRPPLEVPERPVQVLQGLRGNVSGVLVEPRELLGKFVEFFLESDVVGEPHGRMRELVMLEDVHLPPRPPVVGEARNPVALLLASTLPTLVSGAASFQVGYAHAPRAQGTADGWAFLRINDTGSLYEHYLFTITQVGAEGKETSTSRSQWRQIPVSGSPWALKRTRLSPPIFRLTLTEADWPPRRNWSSASLWKPLDLGQVPRRR